MLQYLNHVLLTSKICGNTRQSATSKADSERTIYRYIDDLRTSTNTGKFKLLISHTNQLLSFAVCVWKMILVGPQFHNTRHESGMMRFDIVLSGTNNAPR